MKLRLALLCLLLLNLPAWAASPSKIHSVYSVQRAGQAIGEIQETLTLSSGHYRLESSTIPVGVLAIFVKDIITQTSSGMYDESGFHPQQYTYQRSTKPQKNLDARFDWEKKTALFHFDGKSESQAMPEHMQDRLSLAYQFRYWPKAQDTLRLPVSNGKKITAYNLVRTGEETISVPAGSFRSTRYTRELSADDEGISVWYSEKFAAPIKIIVEEKKGVLTEQVLLRVTSE
jgi:Protein of unknown function (DUF3108)